MFPLYLQLLRRGYSPSALEWAIVQITKFYNPHANYLNSMFNLRLYFRVTTHGYGYCFWFCTRDNSWLQPFQALDKCPWRLFCYTRTCNWWAGFLNNDNFLKFLIKNIASFESLISVHEELNRLGLGGVSIDSKEIKAREDLTPLQIDEVRLLLQQAGIEIFEDRKNIVTRRIKHHIREVVYRDEPLAQNLSVYLAEEMRLDYTYMSNLFSNTEKVTIEKYYICHKIERAKELLLFEQMTLTEIAYKMHYSSLAHLSGQFKKVVGLSPSQFKRQCRSSNLPPKDCSLPER
jgi:AraC-like DNA-binding protein